MIGYHNAGFRRQSSSIQGVVNVVLQQQQDILFLGDLGVARNKIGKLRQTLERKLGDDRHSASQSRMPASIGEFNKAKCIYDDRVLIELSGKAWQGYFFYLDFD